MFVLTQNPVGNRIGSSRVAMSELADVLLVVHALS